MGCSSSKESSSSAATADRGVNHNHKKEQNKIHHGAPHRSELPGTEPVSAETRHSSKLNDNGSNNKKNNNNDNDDNNKTKMAKFATARDDEVEEIVQCHSMAGDPELQHAGVVEIGGTEESSSPSVPLLKLRYAAYSQRGRDPDAPNKPNQDSFGIYHPATGFGGPNGGATTTTTAFFGVYDGHGPHGEGCSQFVQKRLPDLLQGNIKLHDKNGDITVNQVQYALTEAHTECNEDLHASHINDSYSGTTSISLYVHHENRITVSNVGDSRAILGTTGASSASTAADGTVVSLTAVPLSQDQTPRRSDEANRCIAQGARILSFGQIDPRTQADDDEEDVEDPPRVWAKNGRYPGTAFTRSLGDSVAETLGVSAEPELLTVKVSESEKVIVLATDGVFDVLSNQQVIDLCMKHYPDDPARACRTVVQHSHEQWLRNEECLTEESASYDDMTVICIFIDHPRQENDKKVDNSSNVAAAPAEATSSHDNVAASTTKEEDQTASSPSTETTDFSSPNAEPAAAAVAVTKTLTDEDNDTDNKDEDKKQDGGGDDNEQKDGSMAASSIAVPSQKHHPKRRRQKTLRNLEEMGVTKPEVKEP